MQTSEGIVRSLSGAWQVRKQEEAEEADARLGLPASALDLRALLLSIPDYDGCSHRLELFAHAVRHVASSLPGADQRTLLLALAGKLRGRAHACFEYRLHRFPSVDEFLADLYSYFSGLGSELWLLDELQTVRQRGDEPVAEFAARVDRLAGQICAIYDAQQQEAETTAAEEAEGSSNEAREANKKLVRDVALASFRRGLRSTELEVRVGVCQPQRLEEAIRLAIAGENELRFRDKLLAAACRRSTTDSRAAKKRRYR